MEQPSPLHGKNPNLIKLGIWNTTYTAPTTKTPQAKTIKDSSISDTTQIEGLSCKDGVGDKLQFFDACLNIVPIIAAYLKSPLLNFYQKLY